MKLNLTKLHYNPSWDIKHFKFSELKTNKAAEMSVRWMVLVNNHKIDLMRVNGIRVDI